ncbi:MAG: phosphopantothenoylcysteine decarboxylase, partial [bacterium]
LSVRVGFAAETENLLLSSEKKMEGKKLDIVVANTVDRDNNPFGSEKNSVTIFFGEGRESFRDISKKEIAKKIVNSALECYNQKSHEKGGQSK